MCFSLPTLLGHYASACQRLGSISGEIDGLEPARRILAEYRVCIVVLTAFATEEYLIRTKEMGTCGYLLKPFVSETLLAQLEQAYTQFDG